MEMVNRRGIHNFKERRRIMEILIYMAAIFASLAIVAWVKDSDDKEEDEKKELDKSWPHGGINE